MIINESHVKVDDIDIFFKFKNRKYDNNHIIVVFSGFGGDSGITYDFENVLLDSPSYVLWIKDCFFEKCSYYLAKNMDFSIENALIKFIESILKKYSLQKHNVTLCGFSKGGTAALYYGAKYNFKNIIATVPQFNIGSYIDQNWKKIAKHITGDCSIEKIKLLNEILGNTIDNDKFLDKNIYLLTSMKDVQYLSEVQPNLHKFIKYKNFNLLYSESLLVCEHKQVTPYHVPLLLGILYSIAQNAIPNYGCQFLSFDNRLYPINDNNNLKNFHILKKISILNSLLFIEGVGIIRGVSCESYRDIDFTLIFSNDNNCFEYKLAKDHKSNLTKSLYNGYFVNYDKGWFCTPRYNGIDIGNLVSGKYNVLLRINQKEHEDIFQIGVKNIDLLLNSSNENFKFYTQSNLLFCERSI